MLQLDLLTSHLLCFTNQVYAKKPTVGILILTAVVGRTVCLAMAIFQTCLLPINVTVHLIDRTIRQHSHGILPAFSSLAKRHLMNIAKLLISVLFFEIIVMKEGQENDESHLSAYLHPYLNDFKSTYPVLTSEVNSEIKKVFDHYGLEYFKDVNDSLKAGVRLCTKKQMRKGNVRPFGDVQFTCVEISACISQIIYEKLLERNSKLERQALCDAVSALLPSIVKFTYQSQQSFFERLFNNEKNVLNQYVQQAKALFKRKTHPEESLEFVLKNYLLKAKNECSQYSSEALEEIKSSSKIIEIISVILVDLALDTQFYQQGTMTAGILLDMNCPEYEFPIDEAFSRLMKELRELQKNLKNLSNESILELKKQLFFKEATENRKNDQKIQKIFKKMGDIYYQNKQIITQKFSSKLLTEVWQQ